MPHQTYERTQVLAWRKLRKSWQDIARDLGRSIDSVRRAHDPDYLKGPSIPRPPVIRR